MKDSKGYVESRQLHKEGYLHENRVELESRAGVQSISMASERGRNDVNEYAGGLTEKIIGRNNLNTAYKRVKANKGSYGVDGMTVDELLQYLKHNKDLIRQSILEGKYEPKPVRRVEIPKPDGGKRMLGIPTVVDRVIQQAVAQVLSPVFELKFSDSSYEFRPCRSAKQAVLKCRKYIEEGKLKLKVNKEKSTVDRPWRLKFLRFSFYYKRNGIGIRVHQKPIRKFMDKIREITSRSESKPMALKIEKLNQITVGWVNYFGMADMKGLARQLDEWIRRRIRMCSWKQWKKIKTRYDNLVRLGTDQGKAWEYANTRKGYWRIANSPILSKTLTNEFLKKIGFLSLSERYSLVH